MKRISFSNKNKNNPKSAIPSPSKHISTKSEQSSFTGAAASSSSSSSKMTDSNPSHPWETAAWADLTAHAEKLGVDGTHLRDLMQDEARCSALVAEYDDILLDYSRQRITTETMGMLLKLAKAADVEGKIKQMAAGEHINSTEDRAVAHMALRAPKGYTFNADGGNVVPDVQAVLDKIFAFANKIRSAEAVGATGKPLINVISIGIGGSYLGPEFVYEALKTSSATASSASGRTLRFLANVDPVDVKRATEGLDPEETLVIIVSKTFTTAETMLNARTLRDWLVKGVKGADAATVVQKQMIAVSANVPSANEFGIDSANVFGFWDWVGGRLSVCSAVGVVPLALQYGPDAVKSFLDGAHAMDIHFMETPMEKNLPIIMGLMGVWNSTFLKLPVRALLPYSQALLRFPAHIQQVDMESNGKRVALDGTVLPFEAGEVNFGEPGTNGQHSFYQLIHQGRQMACDFVGAVESQQPIDLTSEGDKVPVSNHDELMSNFFAQPDALANGKTIDELKAEGVDEALWAHKAFPGNRPSQSILFPRFDAFRVGQLLALYEHRTAVQGFVWGINSFDQWGVELGKALAGQVRTQLNASRKDSAVPVKGFNSSTSALLKRYLQGTVAAAK